MDIRIFWRNFEGVVNRVDPGLGWEFSGGFPIRGGIRGILFVPCFPPCTLFVRVDLKGDLRVF